MRVNNNTVFGVTYNKLDLLVRALYANLPLSKFLYSHLYSSKLEPQWKRAKQIADALNRVDASFKNQTVLELGPGNSRVLAVFASSHGASEVIQLDKFSRRNDTEEYAEFVANEDKFLERKICDELGYSAGDLADMFNRVQFVIGDISEFRLEQPATFCMSTSVLEHVAEPDKTLHGIRSNLHDGGLSWHHIDLRDHYNFNRRFLFYKYSDPVWRKLLTKEGQTFTNRLRIDDWHTLFRKNQFEIIDERVFREPFEHKQRIAPEFSSKSNDVLEVGQVQILLRAV